MSSVFVVWLEQVAVHGWEERVSLSGSMVEPQNFHRPSI